MSTIFRQWESQKKRGGEAERIFEEILAGNFTNLMKTLIYTLKKFTRFYVGYIQRNNKSTSCNQIIKKKKKPRTKREFNACIDVFECICKKGCFKSYFLTQCVETISETVWLTCNACRQVLKDICRKFLRVLSAHYDKNNNVISVIGCADHSAS